MLAPTDIWSYGDWKCGILADAGIAVFSISAFETDCLLVINSCLEAATEALKTSGH